MIDNYESLSARFPILDVVIETISCADSEKALLKEFFVTVYCLGYRDRQDNR
jgi:hypothetical protein